MDSVTLPPDLERYAAEAVASGRYQDTAEIVRAGIHLLKQMDDIRADFVTSLQQAEAEADRDGWLNIEDVHAEMAALIDKAQRSKT